MSTVAVSGANGFIAQHIVADLVDAGYKVIGTVRSTQKGEELKKNFPKNFDYAIVKELDEEGSFDEILKSHPEIKYFLHTASPFSFEVNDIEKDILNPAINGVKFLFKSIKAYGKNIERVVLTSSLAANANIADEVTPIDEDSWNPITWKESFANGLIGYTASKKFAEEAAWDFLKEEKPSFELATINPVYVFGPLRFESDFRGKLNTSNELINSILSLKKDDELPLLGWTCVDVRDVSKAHIIAISDPKAAGQRFIVSNEKLIAQKTLDVINKNFPEYAGKIPKGTPGEYKATGPPINDKKSREILNLDYVPFEKTIVDLVAQLVNYKKAHPDSK